MSVSALIKLILRLKFTKMSFFLPFPFFILYYFKLLLLYKKAFYTSILFAILGNGDCPIKVCYVATFIRK